VQDDLSKNDFSAALRHGRGRAFLYVQKFGLGGVADAVLSACLKDQAYDRQCESSRAPWLYRMFKNSPEYPAFSSAICSALATETEIYDLEQLCELAEIMAKDGNESAGIALRTRVLGQELAGWGTFGYEALVKLDGMSAVVEFARRFGKVLMDDPRENVPPLEVLASSPDLLAQAQTELALLAKTDDAINVYLEEESTNAGPAASSPTLTKEQREAQRRDRVRAESSIEGILADAAAGVGDYPGRYMNFGKYATEDELHVILRRLSIETEDKALVRMLWTFRRRPLPDLNFRIWALTESENADVRAAVWSALAQNCDPRVGELARTKLRSPEVLEDDPDVLGLLIRNYRPADEVLAMSALSRLTPDDDNAHRLGSIILDIIKENDAPGFAEMVRWVYETNPCTICRHSAVEWLVKNDGMLPAIVAECLYDAEEDIQKLAQQAQGVRETT
jgi:hypothetical protein